jgi:hypothetical protein
MKGRFILATNQLNTDLLPDEKILSEYTQVLTKSVANFIILED